MQKINKIIMIWLIFIASGIRTPLLFSQGEEIITVIVKEGQGPREIAQQVLGEPDLWNEILKINQLNSPSDLRPGMSLIVPIGSIKRSSYELQNTRLAIQTATDVGARVFAADDIARSISLYEEALKERKAGNWENCTRLAVEAHQIAEKSHLETLKKRNTTADAIVTDRSGSVQSREATDMLWRELSLFAKLFENNRVRTLSNSYAEISFQDQSRIRLNENSQAVIQKMRVDLLSKERDSSVKLEKGAAFALLQTSAKKKKFNFNIPGVNTEINSKNFWVQKDEEATKIANYEGEIKVSSDEASVVIEENQGSQITADGSIGDSRDLLKSVELLEPANNTVFSGEEIILKWKPVLQAQKYLLQISADYSFKNFVINKDDITIDSLIVTELKDGAYYWNVAAIDKDGFPGPASPRGFFYVFSDKDKPFLYVNHPQEQEIFRTDTLHVIGETETNVQLSINGHRVIFDENGVFRQTHHLVEGINKIVVLAKDMGGNETEIVRTVMYAANSEVPITYDTSMKQLEPRHFIARGRTLDLKGMTVPLSSVSLQDARTSASMRTFSDESGRFNLSLFDMNESTQMILSVLTPAGYAKNDTLRIQVSKEAPQIVLDSRIPNIFAEDSLNIRGTVSNATRLQYNDKDIKIVDGNFDFTIKLKPGVNLIRLIASDDLDNASIVQNEVMLDRTPPELVDYSIKKRTTDHDDIVEVEVRADDNSGLRRTASVEFLIGDMMTSGYLRYNSISQLYEGSFKFPIGTATDVKLKSLILEDYYGNQKTFSPD
ncbi:FecR domain-containing protein [candidate division KSB1 bacterium]|nr:FecR domain-containing protein [candidate division KSB1 bacterium]